MRRPGRLLNVLCTFNLRIVSRLGLTHFMSLSLAQKVKFLHETADLVTTTEEIFNGKLNFLCSNFSFPTASTRVS